MKFISGLVIGSTIGTTVAILQNNNVSLLENFKQVKNEVVDITSDLSNLKYEVKTTIPNVLNDITKDINKYVSSIEPNIKNIQNQLKNI